MNFIEAMNSNKKVRPKFKTESGYYHRDGWLADIDSLSSCDEIMDYINAEYEVEEPKIEISESEFNKAICKYVGDDPVWMSDVKKELGFKENR